MGTKTSRKASKAGGFWGHYQVSRVQGGTIGTVFNYHPDGNVDRRTNLYYLQTTDFGETWTTADGTPVQIKSPIPVKGEDT